MEQQVEKTKREKYIDELSRKLKEWDKDLEKLEGRIEREVDELKSSYRKRIDELNTKRARIKEKLGKMKESGEQAFEPVKQDLDKLWNDSKSGLKSIRQELFGD